MIRYAFTIFISAFLLFQLEPMIAKFILPWFGGSTLVWTTCLVFFQILLLAGYAYSHLVITHLNSRPQWILHTGLLVVALFFLPVAPSAMWKPGGDDEPTWAILLLLAATIGLPFFLLATTAPLIQAWQSRSHPQRSPFRLYALSNAGSLLALLTYPFVFERYFPLRTQSTWWSIGFVVFALLCFWSGRQFVSAVHREAGIFRHAAATPAVQSRGKRNASALNILLWMLLPMAASVMLLATTNLMTQEVASVPFLWVLPLSLYLFSFILCFDHPRWYLRPLVFPIFFALAIFACYLQSAGVSAGLPIQVAGYAAICFACSMACHGELARLKPDPRQLTLFYLMIAVGGAAGGVFVAILAPRLFVNYYEFQIGLLACIVLSFTAYLTYFLRCLDIPKIKVVGLYIGFILMLTGATVCVAFITGSYFDQRQEDQAGDVIHMSRNAYGTLTVQDDGPSLSLINGRIKHGLQFKQPPESGEPTTYYGATSGLGVALRYFLDRSNMEGGDGLNIGAVGLGVGTISCWGRPQDYVRFYEINPAVQKVAEDYFHYLRDAQADVDVVLGDARVQLEHELANGRPGRFDVLAIDAFSSDSIPIHLLTRECFALYREHLKPGGVLAIHVSNRYLDLEPVVYNAAEANQMQAVLINDTESDRQYDQSTWVLVTNNQDFLHSELLVRAEKEWSSDMPRVLWTDDFGSLVPIIRWDFSLK